MTARGPIVGRPSRTAWSMAAATRRTGIGQHTLRAWERRFGFPTPLRLPSGHRRYTDEQIERLTMIGRALALGHRAGDVVPLSQSRLQALLRSAQAFPATLPSWEARILARAREFDREAIVSELSQAYAGGGVRAFLRERLVPLTEAVGNAWAVGQFTVGHEHFLSEILEDTLRCLRAPLEHSARGRAVLLATLPGERHGMGLQMAALTIALAGRRVRILGVETPASEIGAAAARLDPVAVGISVSASAVGTQMTQAIDALCSKLPGEAHLWVGGSGAQALPSLQTTVMRMVTLDDLELELDRLARLDGASPLIA
jgi:DNA-binding transcriptional MerR regulator/methylmalonyl-CoA mutase cobalamin-binding subunit